MICKTCPMLVGGFRSLLGAWSCQNDFHYYTSTSATALHYYFTLLYSTLLYSTLPYSTLLYSTLLYFTLLYPTLLYSTLPYSTRLYFTLLYSTLPYFTLPYSTRLYFTLLYSTFTCSRWRAPRGPPCEPLGSQRRLQSLLFYRFLPIFTDVSDFLGRLRPSRTTTQETPNALGVSGTLLLPRFTAPFLENRLSTFTS